MKPTRVFLNVQPVGHRKPAGADPFTYQDKRPVRWYASWWTRGTTSEMYRSKTVETRAKAVDLARRWLERQNKTATSRFVDTTDHPERYGYAHESTSVEKSSAQLNAEIDESLAKAGH